MQLAALQPWQTRWGGGSYFSGIECGYLIGQCCGCMPSSVSKDKNLKTKFKSKLMNLCEACRHYFCAGLSSMLTEENEHNEFNVRLPRWRDRSCFWKLVQRCSGGSSQVLVIL